MRIRQLPGASFDLDEALGYYARIDVVLVDFLLDEVGAAKRQIVEHPDAWHPLGGGLRRYLLHKFPYAVVYLPRVDEIMIIAYAHTRRLPDYWKSRLGSVG